ncbi:male sterility protein-domain-containing protein [Xylaria sp. FL1042]|nr:male sterility protein-domain-containing protein [Xylaria sp. FL1042]
MSVTFGHQYLGLTSDEYQKFATNVDVIIFNAWQSNFALLLQAFHPFLSATREIATLAASSYRNMRILFVSTLATVGSMAQETIVPESLVEATLASLNQGYRESKLVAERVLAIASKQASIPVSIARVGQIGGPAAPDAGSWADQAWI